MRSLAAAKRPPRAKRAKRVSPEKAKHIYFVSAKHIPGILKKNGKANLGTSSRDLKTRSRDWELVKNFAAIEIPIRVILTFSPSSSHPLKYKTSSQHVANVRRVK